MNKPQTERPARILIVEDEGLIADDIARRVQKLGFEVAGFATSGAEAIQKAIDLCPDLVLMDIKLKGEMDGIEAATEILKNIDIPIVFLTAHTDPGTIDRAKRTGPCGYLTKPIQQHALPTTIDIALYKHRSERELREQKAWLMTILNTIGHGVAVADTEGCVQYLNPAAERITGWSHNAALEQPISSVLAGSRSESRAQIEDLLANVLQQAKPARLPRGLLVARKGGESALVDGEIAPSLDRQGPLGTVFTFCDATDRELEELQLRHEHKIRAVGTLAAGVAHDFNSLLMVIMGYMDELDELAYSVRGRQAVEQVRKAAEKAGAITKQLLQFSRKQAVQLKEVNVNDVIRDAEPLLRRVAGLQVLLETRLSTGIARLTADPNQLTQILVNLVTNARDAMPAGGALTIETASFSAQDVPLVAQREGVILAVKDTGHGMSAEVAGRLFEPFFTTKEPGKGTGLGLSIVHSIVSDLGGVVLVDSKPGEGSTFLIYLPQSEASPKAAGKIIDSGESGMKEASEITVLLVDDDDGVRSLLAAYLTSTNYRVLTAASGAEALAIAESHPTPIDALITDLMMPGMNGLQLANELKSRGLTSRVLFISGYADEFVRGIGDFPAASTILPKPFSRNDLIRGLSSLLGLAKTASAA